MTGRLLVIWEGLRNSLWALPIALVAVAAGLAVAAVQLRLPLHGTVDWLYSGGASQARGFLGNLLTAMITMATLAISITMVVLALAAQSLGPRLIPIFMGDIRTKVILGILIGTVAYLLIVLRTIAGTDASVPQLAVTLGTVLVLTSMILVLFFVHHLANSIVADTIIARVGADLDSSARSLLPEPNSGDDAGSARPSGSGKSILAKTSGYVQLVERASIARAAAKKNAVVVVAHRPGQFALPGDTLATVWPGDAVDDGLASAIRNAVPQGRYRTPVQDLEYSIRQLVEIALRALSPGVNDPHTALAVIDQLTASFTAIMRRGEQQSVHRDEKGAVRLITPISDFSGLLDAALNEIRQAGATQPTILIRIADRLGQLLLHAPEHRKYPIRRHIQLVLKSGRRGIPDAADRNELESRIADALYAPTGGG